jgi:hypothetical protein
MIHSIETLNLLPLDSRELIETVLTAYNVEPVVLELL